MWARASSAQNREKFAQTNRKSGVFSQSYFRAFENLDGLRLEIGHPAV